MVTTAIIKETAGVKQPVMDHTLFGGEADMRQTWDQQVMRADSGDSGETWMHADQALMTSAEYHTLT